jgi:hypothetical protein
LHGVGRFRVLAWGRPHGSARQGHSHGSGTLCVPDCVLPGPPAVGPLAGPERRVPPAEWKGDRPDGLEVISGEPVGGYQGLGRRLARASLCVLEHADHPSRDTGAPGRLADAPSACPPRLAEHRGGFRVTTAVSVACPPGRIPQFRRVRLVWHFNRARGISSRAVSREAESSRCHRVCWLPGLRQCCLAPWRGRNVHWHPGVH